MGLKIDTVAHACRLITREIQDAYKNLTVHYIIHHEGQRNEALGVAAQQLIHHPAAETAMHILQRPRSTEDSVLLGTAVARQPLFFGLAMRDRLLALCTLNLDQFDSLKEARRFAYHLAWHAIDALEYHSNPANRTGASTEVLIRRRGALEMAYANLKADAFSALISALHSDREAINRMALVRSAHAIVPRSLQSPEYYPFAIAADATKFAFEHINAKQLPKKKLVPTALKLAGEVAKTFDENAMEYWLSFSEPAQDMAWRGYTRDEILGAAINTSPSTHIRSTGYLVSEITGVKPCAIARIKDSYSPFADESFNLMLHERIVSETFEDVIAQGLRQKSMMPFLRIASQQNEALSEGRVIGWCAAALQAAAMAYESALSSGNEPEMIARREFEDERGKTAWENIKKLSDRVVDQKRGGTMVTMGKLAELCQSMEGVNAVQKSIEKTMRDPVYQQKLEAARELTPNAPRSAAPQPSAAPRQAAAPAAGPRGPGLGSSSATAAGVQARQAKEQGGGEDGGKAAN